MKVSINFMFDGWKWISIIVKNVTIEVVKYNLSSCKGHVVQRDRMLGFWVW